MQQFAGILQCRISELRTAQHTGNLLHTASIVETFDAGLCGLSLIVLVDAVMTFAPRSNLRQVGDGNDLHIAGHTGHYLAHLVGNLADTPVSISSK